MRDGDYIYVSGMLAHVLTICSGLTGKAQGEEEEDTKVRQEVESTLWWPRWANRHRDSWEFQPAGRIGCTYCN